MPRRVSWAPEGGARSEGVPSRKAALEGVFWSNFVICLNIHDLLGNYSVMCLIINCKIPSRMSFQQVRPVL